MGFCEQTPLYESENISFDLCLTQLSYICPVSFYIDEPELRGYVCMRKPTEFNTFVSILKE